MKQTLLKLKMLTCDTALTFISETVTPYLGHCLMT